MIRHILKYLCLSLIFSTFGHTGYSQVKRTKGPRIGFDVSHLVRRYFEPGHKVYAFSLDYEIDLDYFPVVEFGLFETHKSQETLDYSSNGFFCKAGLDYNLTNVKGPWDHDIFFSGFRLGFSQFNHQASDILIRNDYWGDYQIDEISSNKLRAFWFSAVLGMKVELTENLFIGWSLRGRIMLAKDRDPDMPPDMIPGYGKGDSSSNLGIQYFVSFRVPLLKEDFVKR